MRWYYLSQVFVMKVNILRIEFGDDGWMKRLSRHVRDATARDIEVGSYLYGEPGMPGRCTRELQIHS
jgi:hypothetical protein